MADSPAGIQEKGETASSVEVLIQRFSNYVQALQKSPRTVSEYTKVIKAWYAWWRKPLADFGPEAWDQWMFYQTERGTKGVTIRTYQSAIRKFYKFLRRQKVVSHDPSQDAEAVGVIKRLPEFLTEEEVGAMYGAAERSAKRSANIAMLELLYSCGLRNTELRNLPLENIGKTYVLVHGKGGRDRKVDISPLVSASIRAYTEGRKGGFYAFGERKGKRIAMMTVLRVIRQLAASAGITRRVHPHMLRHSIATHLLARGCGIAYIQRFLGHGSIETTRIYTAIVDTVATKAILDAHPRS